MKPTVSTSLSHLLPALLCSLLLAAAIPASAFDSELTGELKDAWLTGKAETVLALNEHLNRYAIGARVTEGVVTLTGMVGSAVDKSLATELMKGIADIRSVNNDLEVDANIEQYLDEDKANSRSSFARWINDLTTTAIVRSKLLRHGDVTGTTIDVSTNRRVVTLSGSVSSAAESALAEEIARNTGGVVEVRNNLAINNEGVELSRQ